MNVDFIIFLQQAETHENAPKSLTLIFHIANLFGGIYRCLCIYKGTQLWQQKTMESQLYYAHLGLPFIILKQSKIQITAH